MVVSLLLLDSEGAKEGTSSEKIPFGVSANMGNLFQELWSS